MLIPLVCVIYQKKAFWALYNIGVAFSYRKMQSKGRKSLKTLNLWRPSLIFAFCKKCPSVTRCHPVEYCPGGCKEHETAKKHCADANARLSKITMRLLPDCWTREYLGQNPLHSNMLQWRWVFTPPEWFRHWQLTSEWWSMLGQQLSNFNGEVFQNT